MADYYIGHCDFTQQEWQDVDLPSRLDFCDMLSTALSNYVSDIFESSGHCCFDISSYIKDRPVVYELKDRNMPSTKYGDIMVEKDKYDNNKKYCPLHTCVAVNSFTDGVIAMCVMTEKTMKVSHKRCPATTLCRGASHKYVIKECATMPQQLKFKRTDGTWRKI